MQCKNISYPNALFLEMPFELDMVCLQVEFVAYIYIHIYIYIYIYIYIRRVLWGHQAVEASVQCL